MSAVVYNVVCSKCGQQTGYSHTPFPHDFVCAVCLDLKKPSKPSNNRMTKPEARRMQRLTDIRPVTKLVTDFSPSGRSGLYIYAVVVKQHPDKVKIGMTRKWVNRRKAYANWDLSPGDAILEERVFCINEEFVDLEKLENHILQTFDASRAFGAEWFFASLDDACRHIDRIMCGSGISYDM